MAREGVLLGVDLGTTATKVVAVSADARVLFTTEHGYPLVTAEDGRAEQNPDEVLSAAVAGLRTAADRCAGAGTPVVGLALTGAMHTLLGLVDGVPVTPVYTWADSRAAPVADRLRRDGTAAPLHLATGTPVHAMSPLVKLVWLRQSDPDLFDRVGRWVGVKDYVLHHLTGRLVTDPSLASGTGMLEMSTLDWHPGALAVAGIPADRLPGLVPSTDCPRLTPDAAGGTGLPAGLPVIVGLGDGPAANLGVGAVNPGTAAVSLGTSGAMRVVVDAPHVDTRGRLFCYPLADGLWVTGGAVSNGGLVVQWLLDLFEPVDIETLLTEADDIAPGSDGLLALPYLIGERGAYDDTRADGLLLGLRRIHRRSHVTRAVIEGVGNQLALVDAAIRETSVVIRDVRATGGVFRAPVWATVVAAALDRRLHLAEDNEGSGLGAALLGWRALGAFDSLYEVADLISLPRTVTPDPVAVSRQRESRRHLHTVYEAALRFPD